jgi:glyoxalase superfamily protein
MLTGIVFDALDVALMEDFWRAATRGRTDGLRLRFVPTDKPKVGKNRLHLDLAGGADWDAEVERLLALGAVRVDIGQGDVPWDVLADPEGNEFCVLRPGHPGVLTDSGLAAICLDMAEEDRERQSAFWRAKAAWDVITYYDWGVRLRRTESSPVSLVMGPPAAPKTGRNRVRLEVRNRDWGVGEFCDPGGNELEVEVAV